MYPYDFRPEEKGIRHREIFVAMPFKDEYNVIFDQLIAPATEKASKILKLPSQLSLTPYRTKDDMRTASGWINIMNHLFSAQIVMGVLTSDNPNVFYELGIAHATQPIMRQILIAEKGYEARFDIKDLIYFEYDLDDIDSSFEKLADKIADAIRWYDIHSEKIVKKALSLISPYGIDVIAAFGVRRNFHIHKDMDEHESEHGKGSYQKHMRGLENLIQSDLVGLNTKPKRKKRELILEWSYYWTNFGNDVLHYLEVIDNEELTMRRETMPEALI